MLVGIAAQQITLWLGKNAAVAGEEIGVAGVQRSGQLAHGRRQLGNERWVTGSGLEFLLQHPPGHPPSLSGHDQAVMDRQGWDGMVALEPQHRAEDDLALEELERGPGDPTEVRWPC